MALQMLYQCELGEATPPQARGNFDRTAFAGGGGEDLLARAFEYAETLLVGVWDHREEIDELIKAQADNWRLERMPPVDRNILRLATYELLYEADVPQLVVIDEAIELAKKFGSEQSGRFVNGLLDGLLKGHTFPGKLK